MKAFLMSMAWWSMAWLIATAAHAEVIVPKGNKATLRVEYVYTSAGKYLSPSRDQKRDWNARRTVTLTGNYVADAPQPLGALHQDDAKQQSQMASLQTTMTKHQKNLEPTMNDMVAISEKCEREAALPNDRQDEAKFEACVGQAIMSYRMSGDQLAKSQAASKAVSGIVSQMSVPRFQTWKLITQDGQYSIDETYSRQVYEMTCTEVKVCKRTEMRRGGGRIPAPPGKPGVGVSLLEVDGEKRDMVMMLPLPLAPLAYTQTVTSTIDSDKSGTQDGVMPIQWMMKAQQITIAVPGDLRSVSGSKTFPLEGQNEEKGTLTVNWLFTRQ